MFEIWEDLQNSSQLSQFIIIGNRQDFVLFFDLLLDEEEKNGLKFHTSYFHIRKENICKSSEISKVNGFSLFHEHVWLERLNEFKFLANHQNGIFRSWRHIQDICWYLIEWITLKLCGFRFLVFKDMKRWWKNRFLDSKYWKLKEVWVFSLHWVYTLA